MKNVMTGSYFYNDEVLNFNFGTDLTAEDKVAFVSSVTETLVGSNYNYIVKDLIFDFMIVKLFTSVDTTEIKEINKIEEFLDKTNIVDIVEANAKEGLIEELKKSVDLNIEYRTGIHTNYLNEALANLVNTLENKIANIDLDSAMEMAKNFAGMTSELTPESIVNAYINSDVHKNNLVEIKESKKKKSESLKDMDKKVKSIKGATKNKLN